MKGLDDAILRHIQYLVLTEHRPFSYREFCSKEVKGQPYAMAHGTFRNKVSRFRKLGIVEQEYNAGTAFYTIKGVHFGKRKNMMTPPMTPNHMVVSSVTKPNSVTLDSTKLPIYKEIQKLPPDQKALHDIHYKFQLPDIWTILSLSKKYSPNSVSKDISLPPITSNNLKIRTFVHKTDTVTVTVACSGTPIASNIEDVIRLSNGLTRTEERLSRILDECGKALPGGYESIPIPDHCKWIVTLWHFGVDSYNYREYADKNYCVTWSIVEKVLARTYSKNRKYNGLRNRREIQQCPNKPFAEAIKNLYQQEGV